MKRATITIPDDLERSLNEYLAEQDAPPSFTALAQVALREYLQKKRLEERGYRPAQGSFHIDPLEEIDEHGEPDVSVNHDAYFHDAYFDKR